MIIPFSILILSSLPYKSSGFDGRHPHLIRPPVPASKDPAPSPDVFPPLWVPLGMNPEGTNGTSTTMSGSLGGSTLETRSTPATTEVPEWKSLPQIGDMFRGFNGTTLRSQVGSTAVLDCWIQIPPFELEREGGPVMWSRDNPFALLALGGQIHIQDPRFWTQHPPSNRSSEEGSLISGGQGGYPTKPQEPLKSRVSAANGVKTGYHRAWNWPLVIRGLQLSDNGTYQCQTSSDPPSFLFTQLVVVEAKAAIHGPRERYLRLGSTLHLECRFHNMTAHPTIVFWYRGDRMVAYDPDVQIVTDLAQNQTQLTIEHVNYSHAGNYTCMPSPLVPDSTLVHVITDEDKAPAAVYINGGLGSKLISHHQVWMESVSLVFYLAIRRLVS